MESQQDYENRIDGELALAIDAIEEAAPLGYADVLARVQDFRRSRLSADEVLVGVISHPVYERLTAALVSDLQRPDPLTLPFRDSEHAQLAALIYRRFGGAEAGAAAWRRLMQNSTSESLFLALARQA